MNGRQVLTLLLRFPRHRCDSCSCLRPLKGAFCSQCGGRLKMGFPLLPMTLILLLCLGFAWRRSPEAEPPVLPPVAASGPLSAHNQDLSLNMSLEQLMDRVDELMKTSNSPHSMQRAIGLLDEAIARNPRYGYGLRLKANLLRIGRHHEASLKAWRVYLESFPEDYNSMYMLANQLIRLEKYEEALALLQQVLDVWPDFADAHKAMAQACEASGLPEKARIHQESASRANRKPPLMIHPRIPKPPEVQSELAAKKGK